MHLLFWSQSFSFSDVFLPLQTITAGYHCVFTLVLFTQIVYTVKGKVKYFLDVCLCQKQENNRQKKASFRDRKFKPIRVSISIVINDAVV